MLNYVIDDDNGSDVCETSLFAQIHTHTLARPKVCRGARIASSFCFVFYGKICFHFSFLFFGTLLFFLFRPLFSNQIMSEPEIHRGKNATLLLLYEARKSKKEEKIEGDAICGAKHRGFFFVKLIGTVEKCGKKSGDPFCEKTKKKLQVLN